METVPLLQQLIAIDSTSVRSNAPMLDALEAHARKLGFETARTAWLDANGVEKGNLVCRRGPDVAGGLALVGHTDCVPYDPEWNEALSGAVRDGAVFGRGSADTKGFVACALTAAHRERNRAPLWLLFTADEEDGCWGAKKLLERDTPRPAQAIVGEPTRLVPIRAHKGYCAVDVEVLGVEGHSAFPDVGASAIHAAARLVAELPQVEAAMHDDLDHLFVPPWTTFNVGVIQGGKARNILAGSCRFTLEWRPVPGQDPARGLALFDEAARRIEAASGGRIRVTHTPLRLDKAAVTPPDAEIVRFLEQESGNRAEGIPFGTELPELIDLGAEACVFGPGDIRVAHRTGEHVAISELETATAILQRAIARFCA